MTIEGVDYSDSRPGGAALAAAGKHFAIRYVPYGGYTKGLTASELADLRSHGLSVGLVFESLANRPVSGLSTVVDIDYAHATGSTLPATMNPTAAGKADAWWSQKQLAVLGLPANLPIYFAMDFDTTPGNQAAIDTYLRAAASVLGASRVGVYGSFYVVERCFTNGSAKWFWQTLAWSGGQVSSHNHLYQYHNGVIINGAEVDLTRALAADFGQYPRPVTTLPDTSTSVPVYTVRAIPGPHRIFHIPARSTTPDSSKVIWTARIPFSTAQAHHGIPGHWQQSDGANAGWYWIAGRTAGFTVVDHLGRPVNINS